MASASRGLVSAPGRPQETPPPPAPRPQERDPRILKEQYDTLPQQRQAASLGMWVFLATEVLLFGGLFLGYTVYRTTYPEAWRLASQHTYYWFGTVNTAVLLTSSLTMALAVSAAQDRPEDGRRKGLIAWLLLTALLGALFMGIKLWEYSRDLSDHSLPGHGFDFGAYPAASAGPAALFWSFYWLMTGLHAFHLTVAILLVLAMVVLAAKGKIWSENDTPVRMTALFWHLVDVIWVFLYPLLYLVGTRH